MVAQRDQRTPAELREMLSGQVELLMLAAANFDDGHTVAGKQLATTLRVLLYAPVPGRNRGRTNPLLHQLRLIENRFLSTEIGRAHV